MPTCLLPSICKASFGKTTDYEAHVVSAHGPGILRSFREIEWIRFNHGFGHRRFVCSVCRGDPADCEEHDDFGAVSEEEFELRAEAEAG